MMNKKNKFHLVTMSPWPLLVSMMVWENMMEMCFNIYKNTLKMSNSTSTKAVITIYTTISWWKNTIKESLMEGNHQKKILEMIKNGMLMFITSEVMFFISFFWAYFHLGTSPNVEIGQSWPPKIINPFNPINVPLLNTIILVSSGFSITWSHHLKMKNKSKKSLVMISITLLMGIYFSLLQMVEYKTSQFSMNDSSFGSIFFMATGFHGFHVLVGSTFILVVASMMKKMSLTNKNHMSFEIAAWYWHFVDVVWLYLYVSVYWWSKK